MARVTAARRTKEQVASKDARAELKAYLAEALLVIDEKLPPARQAEMVLAWWKVQVLVLLVTRDGLLTATLNRRTNIGSLFSVVLHATT